MNATDVVSSPAVASVRWVARIFGLLLFVFWGSFFVEHLAEWFRGSAATPPLRVLLIQLAHLVLLVGLAIAWRWELAGSVLIILGALAFFSQAAGRNFPLFFGVTIIPAILYAFCWRKSRM